jgi:hypothetical protein
LTLTLTLTESHFGQKKTAAQVELPFKIRPGTEGGECARTSWKRFFHAGVPISIENNFVKESKILLAVVDKAKNL